MGSLLNIANEAKNATGNRPRRGGVGGRCQRLVFDEDENNYEYWEVKLLGHLKILGLNIILSTNKPDAEKNAECYAEPVSSRQKPVADPKEEA